MTARTLPRSARGRALPRTGTDTVTWPPALRGHSPLPVLALLGWLGGGLLATAVALVAEGPNDLAYGLLNTAAAIIGLLVLAVAPRRLPWRVGGGARAARTVRLDEPVPVRVPAQASPDPSDVSEPALR